MSNPQEEMVFALELILEKDPNILPDMERAMKEIFSSQHVPFTVSHLEAFVLGIRMASNPVIKSPFKDNVDDPHGSVAMMAAFALKMVKDKKAELAKIKI